ncbi:recombinase family protein [Myceligenerans crystallogenes]|uniref:Resolvase/invertase-type recombinase catalytic domain-containing protein n=1 Tax=Myceligenerans crystallogenes TaxID=316335 RepID=A0ABN2N1S6_9MICO
MSGAALEPLVYGYVRVEENAPPGAVRRLEDELRALVESRGMCFGATFYDVVPGQRGGLRELTEELRRSESRLVVVPTLDHLSRHPGVRAELLNQLRDEARATVVPLAA